jgi:hypothetical protein
VGVQVPLSVPHFKRLIRFGLDLIQLVNLGLDLMDAPDRPLISRRLSENKALPTCERTMRACTDGVIQLRPTRVENQRGQVRRARGSMPHVSTLQ